MAGKPEIECVDVQEEDKFASANVGLVIFISWSNNSMAISGESMREEVKEAYQVKVQYQPLQLNLLSKRDVH